MIVGFIIFFLGPQFYFFLLKDHLSKNRNEKFTKALLRVFISPFNNKSFSNFNFYFSFKFGDVIAGVIANPFT